MSKNIVPTMGQPAAVFLNEAIVMFKNDSWQPNDCTPEFKAFCGVSEEMRALLMDVLDYVNANACLNESQTRLLKEDLEMWRVRIAELSGATLNEEADRFVHELTTSINGFNLDCGSCLAENCEPRDPDVTLERVQENAKKLAIEKVEGASELSIHDLLENRRISNFLSRVHGIRTDADLCKKSESDLLAIPGFGRVFLKKVKRALDERGKHLRIDEVIN